MLGKENSSLKPSKILILLAVLFFLFLAVFGSTASASQSEASSSISSAQKKITDCYNAVKAAEAAGANISVLTSELNEAGLLLSQAQLSYSKSDFDAASNYAVQSQNQLETFVGQADGLMQAASRQRSQDFLINFVGSIVGACAVVVVGLMVWFLLERKCGTGDKKQEQEHSRKYPRWFFVRRCKGSEINAAATAAV
jgi:flagellar basal body-associated protein FliL